MLNVDAQQRAREALRQVDQALANEAALEAEVRRQAQLFRDTLFGAFQFIEQESLQLRELLIKLQRGDANQLQIAPKGRPAFLLMVDPEIAFGSRAMGSRPLNEGAAPVELSARLYAVMMPPSSGLLRYYTIFGDGVWKRTTFTAGPKGMQARHAQIGRIGADLLIREAIDLLGYACMVYASWATLTDEATIATPRHAA
ncbi:MAG: hypothetical protein HC893_03975 [Chloroflexaceae bacterium]|nr:hypothetical protein [Chloroflexaceae bacterium]